MITFVGLKNRTAGLVRGVQISEVVPKSNFFDHSEILSKLDDFNKSVIVVRNRPNRQIENILKSRGHILGYDIIDSVAGEFYFRKNPVNYKNHIDDSVYDFYIVNNTYTKNILRDISNKSAHVIPHHHVNTQGFRSYDGSGQIKVAGYLGLPEQLTDKEEISDILKRYDIDFKTCNPKTKAECVNFLKSIQLGITNMRNEYTDVFLKAKPNTKISNYQSFGIVSLCNEYESYREFGDGAYLSHIDLESFENNLKALVERKDIRERISNCGFRNSDRFNIKSIVSKFYVEIGKLNEKKL
jgi:hypothetical protein